MPARAKRPCGKPGCNQLGLKAYCPAHRRDNTSTLVLKESRRQFDAARLNDPHRLIYRTAAWARTRKAILQRDPICKIADLCVKRYGTALPSAEVDHIVPVRAGGPEYDPENLQGVCHSCHSKKTSHECGINPSHDLGMNTFPARVTSSRK